ncbi:hypothetical protein BC332_00305 [Capsicum chinense]|nr:hypothetical protein BC332_00305 [Capsicum chinense]
MTEENYDSEMPLGFGNEMDNVVGRISSCGSRKRPISQSFYPVHVQQQPSSHKHRSTVGVQDRATSLEPSIHRYEEPTEDKGCRISAVAKSQLGQNNTSLAMHPLSGLMKEVETEIEDVAPDIIQGGTGEGRTSVVQGTIVSPSIQEEGQTTNGAWCDHKTKRNADLSNQPTCDIVVDFLQQVAVAFEEVKANQEESTRSAKDSISMHPSLEPTFLAIVKKHGDITKDCLLESGYMLTSVLEAICKVVQELQQKHLSQFNCDLLNSYYSVVRDTEKMKVNVNWLRTRLDEIKDAVNCIVETKNLDNEKNRLTKQIENEKKDLESMNAELEKLKSEIARKENQQFVYDRALRIQQFKNMPLMETFQ